MTNRWGNSGNSDSFILGGSKITADRDCSHEIKRRLFLERSYDQPAAAAAKSLQSCPTLCDPIDSSPPGFPAPGILQARTLEWVAISFSNAGKWKVKVKSFSCVWLFTTPWTPRQHIKKQRHYFANKGQSGQGYVFSSSHVWMWKLDYKGSLAPKNWCFWTMVLEKTLESLGLQGDPTSPS